MIATALIVLGILTALCALGGAGGWAFRRLVRLASYALWWLDRRLPFPGATRTEKARYLRKLKMHGAAYGRGPDRFARVIRDQVIHKIQ